MERTSKSRLVLPSAAEIKLIDDPEERLVRLRQVCREAWRGGLQTSETCQTAAQATHKFAAARGGAIHVFQQSGLGSYPRMHCVQRKALQANTASITVCLAAANFRLFADGSSNWSLIRRHGRCRERVVAERRWCTYRLC